MTTPPAPTDSASFTDGRNRLLRWWHRKTLGRYSGEGSLLVIVKVQLGWLDRLLITLGRDCEVECRSPASDEAIVAAVEGIQSTFRTVPRSWR